MTTENLIPENLKKAEERMALAIAFSQARMTYRDKFPEGDLAWRLYEEVVRNHLEYDIDTLRYCIDRLLEEIGLDNPYFIQKYSDKVREGVNDKERLLELFK